MFVTLLIIAVVSLAAYLKWFLGYFKRRGIDGPAGWPLVGSMGDYLMGKEHFALVYHRIYNAFPSAKYVGFFKFTTPTVLVRDLDVVHDVMIKRFPDFGKNDFFVNGKIDPLLIQSPFVQTGEEWKKTRAMLTPIFTPARVKQLLPIVNETVAKLTAHIQANEGGDFDTKKLCFKYTMENVASCAFGLQGGCFEDGETSDFFRNGSNIFSPNILFNITTLFFPSLTHIIEVPIISKEIDAWLRCIVQQVLEERKKDGAVPRNDFLQFLIDLQKKSPEDFTKDTIVGHCLTFLTEGTETSSITMTYLLYELAVHPEFQERLREELDQVTENGKVSLTGDMIGQLKFLDRVVEETLRLHSPVLSINKICTQRTELPAQYNHGGRKLVVEEGTPIVIPLWSIHRDSNHFRDPLKFDPDRYENDNIPKMAHLGFGEGSRLCLGKNFALFQVKLAILEIVRKFRIVLSDKMKEPPAISVKAFLLHCDDGIWIKFQKR